MKRYGSAVWQPFWWWILLPFFRKVYGCLHPPLRVPLFWYQWVPLLGWLPSRAGRQFLALAHLQLGITLLLLPVQIAMFHGFSLTSFPANLFAVPLVTFVSVPLILAGMIVHLAGLGDD